MKKIIIILLTSALVILSSCAAKFEPEKRISGLSEDLFYYTGEDFNLTLYPEIREIPYEKDGFVGETDKYLIFKLNSPVGVNYSQTPKINFQLDGKKYEGEFEFRPVSYSLLCVLNTSSFPIGSIEVSLNINEKEENIVLDSLKNEEIVSYKDIIKNLKNYSNQSVAEFAADPEKYELRIRLLEDEGFNYWFISVIGKENSTELLFDAENGEPIAVKEEKNNKA
ncbi:MAG: hypothetical protein IJ800_00070 [Clostridia bacterium]|nr:hypothetical protein [Clostridia bacterium]